MNTYIVIANCNMDDIPIAVFCGRSEHVADAADACAHDCAKSCTVEDVNKAAAKLGCSVSDPVCVSVVEMRDGVPYGRRVVKRFDEGDSRTR